MTTVEVEIDMDAVVAELHRRGVHAYVEQTGGGCATIQAGAQHVDAEGGTRWAALAGPGWFDGPGWTEARALAADFYVGADDDGEGPVSRVDTSDPAAIADAIIAKIKEATPA